MSQKNTCRVVGSVLGLYVAFGVAQAGEVVVLPSLTGAGALAWDINDDGVAIGQSVSGLGSLVAVRWDAARSPSSLGMLAGTVASEAYAINNNGQVVGYSEDAQGARLATYWDGQGAMINMHAAMNASGSSIPWDINDDGLVVGQASINPGLPKGFVWEVGTTGQVAGGLPGYMSSRNLAINNNAVIVGSSFFFGDPDDAHRATPDGRGGWDSVQIGPHGFEFTVAHAINNKGTAVGYTTYNSTTAGWNAVIFDGDSDVIVLGTLESLDTSEAYDINDNGLIVGQAFDGAGIGHDPRAWAWTDGTMTDLNDLLEPGSPFEILLGATGVNNNNDIVGFGRLTDGTLAGFVVEGFGATCAPDMNADGALDFFDVQAFLQAFSAMDPSADFVADGVYDFFDVLAFLQAFSDGCP